MPKFSASRLKLITSCERRAGFKYLEKIKTEVGEPASLGLEVHAVLERHFKKEERLENYDHIHNELLPDPIRVALGAVHLVPVGQVIGVEHKFEFSYQGVDFRGAIDLLVREGQTLHLIDHKTSSNPKRHGLDEKGLWNDIQANIYAAFMAFERDSKWSLGFQDDLDWNNNFQLDWVYYRTKPVDKRYFGSKISIIMDPEDALSFVSKNLIPVAKTWNEYHIAYESGKLKLHQLRTNHDFCFAYGKRCPYAELCDESERVALFQEDPTMPGFNIDELIEKRKLEMERVQESVNAPEYEPQEDFKPRKSPPSTPPREKAPIKAAPLKTKPEVVDEVPRVNLRQALELLAEGKTIFARDSKLATRDMPFLHGNVLKGLRRHYKDKLTEYQHDAGVVRLDLSPDQLPEDSTRAIVAKRVQVETKKEDEDLDFLKQLLLRYDSSVSLERYHTYLEVAGRG